MWWWVAFVIIWEFKKSNYIFYLELLKCLLNAIFLKIILYYISRYYLKTLLSCHFILILLKLIMSSAFLPLQSKHWPFGSGESEYWLISRKRAIHQFNAIFPKYNYELFFKILFKTLLSGHFILILLKLLKLIMTSAFLPLQSKHWPFGSGESEYWLISRKTSIAEKRIWKELFIHW